MMAVARWILRGIAITLFGICLHKTGTKGHHDELCTTGEGHSGLCVAKIYCREPDLDSLIKCEDQRLFCCPVPTPQPYPLVNQGASKEDSKNVPVSDEDDSIYYSRPTNENNSGRTRYDNNDESRTSYRDDIDSRDRPFVQKNPNERPSSTDDRYDSYDDNRQYDYPSSDQSGYNRDRNRQTASSGGRRDYFESDKNRRPMFSEDRYRPSNKESDRDSENNQRVPSRTGEGGTGQRDRNQRRPSYSTEGSRTEYVPYDNSQNQPTYFNDDRRRLIPNDDKQGRTSPRDERRSPGNNRRNPVYLDYDGGSITYGDGDRPVSYENNRRPTPTNQNSRRPDYPNRTPASRDNLKPTVTDYDREQDYFSNGRPGSRRNENTRRPMGDQDYAKPYDDFDQNYGRPQYEDDDDRKYIPMRNERQPDRPKTIPYDRETSSSRSGNERPRGSASFDRGRNDDRRGNRGDQSSRRRPADEVGRPSANKPFGSSRPSRPSVRYPMENIPECGVKPYELFIAGGEQSDPHEWPWMTAIFRRYQGTKPKTFICGGSLINRRYVLTAAHCFIHNYVTLPASSFVVRLGSHRLNSGEEYTLSDIILHENHSTSDHFNDIALARIAAVVYVSDKVAPICLPTQKMALSALDNRIAMVAGWGDVSYRAGASVVLQQVSVPIISNEECFASYARVPGTAFLARGTDHVICAGLREGGKDACSGDSGGPLMLKSSDDLWTVIGIVSLGHKCAEAGYPGIYTRVTHYVPWIKRKMKMI